VESESGISRTSYWTIIGTKPGSEYSVEVLDKSRRYNILEKIAICESGGKHFEDNGQVLKGKINPSDIGKYQINLKYWKADASRLGLNIYDPEDNEIMARWIFDNYGTKPWNWSISCWGKGSSNAPQSF